MDRGGPCTTRVRTGTKNPYLLPMYVMLSATVGSTCESNKHWHAFHSKLSTERLNAASSCITASASSPDSSSHSLHRHPLRRIRVSAFRACHRQPDV